MEKYKAGIFDLDGVITRTARLHQKAWRKLFEDYRMLRRQKGKPTFDPYQPEDYKNYIDGKPRHDGLRDFLESRDLKLPEGQPGDAIEDETIYGLGNYKNETFLRLIEEEGVDIYEDSVNRIRQWRDAGLKTAIISASKNCLRILQAAGLTELFDARVDGVVARARGLKGKPAPDVLLEAARELGASPGEAFVVEDALPGIRAARAGNFALVVGISRGADAEELRAEGADVVVGRLGQLSLEALREVNSSDLPNALEHKAALEKRLEERPPLLFLDFDGTMTPIVEDRHRAHIDPEVQNTLKAMVPHVRLIAVVSGRDLLDLRQRVDVGHRYYLGSHGFEMYGPGRMNKQQPEALKLLPQLEQAEKDAHNALDGVEGVDIERKRFAIAVHYRRAGKAGAQKAVETVRRIATHNPDLRCSGGKKVIEIRPDIEWDKGKALHWIIREVGLRESDFTPIYIGDDLTDEDAYREIRDSGISIQVGDHGEKTYAHYALRDVEEVRQFLVWLFEMAQKARAKERSEGVKEAKLK
jgi:alpha,alpha-trehalase